MIVFRLTKEKYKNDLSGTGAEKAGGRWNSKGVAIIYTSSSRALSTAEIAVHTPLGIVPTGYQIVTIEFPDSSLISTVTKKDLPDDWKTFPHLHETQEIGDQFIAEGKLLVLKVPSVVIQGDYNYLLNPNHPKFFQVKILNIEPFGFDERLLLR